MQPGTIDSTVHGTAVRYSVYGILLHVRILTMNRDRSTELCVYTMHARRGPPSTPDSTLQRQRQGL